LSYRFSFIVVGILAGLFLPGLLDFSAAPGGASVMAKTPWHAGMNLMAFNRKPSVKAVLR